MSTTYEGVIRGGTIELNGHPRLFEGSRVHVTIDEPDEAPESIENSEEQPNLREWALEIARKHAAAQVHKGPRRPSGAPIDLPTDEEWAVRAKEAVQLMRQWQQEEPSDDLATREEIARGLRENPIQFREVSFDE